MTRLDLLERSEAASRDDASWPRIAARKRGRLKWFLEAQASALRVNDNAVFAFHPPCGAIRWRVEVISAKTRK